MEKVKQLVELKKSTISEQEKRSIRRGFKQFDEQGVHASRPDIKGASTAGMEARSSQKLKALSNKMTTPVSAKRNAAEAASVMGHSAKMSHVKKLKELLSMPKPNLPKVEKKQRIEPAIVSTPVTSTSPMTSTEPKFVNAPLYTQGKDPKK